LVREDLPLPYTERGEGVLPVVFAPGSNTLATAFTDRTVKIWDFETRKTIHMLPKHDGEIRASKGTRTRMSRY
jgi:WD40 repeat protein